MSGLVCGAVIWWYQQQRCPRECMSSTHVRTKNHSNNKPKPPHFTQHTHLQKPPEAVCQQHMSPKHQQPLVAQVRQQRCVAATTPKR